jgi:hypothetical protein
VTQVSKNVWFEISVTDMMRETGWQWVSHHNTYQHHLVRVLLLFLVFELIIYPGKFGNSHYTSLSAFVIYKKSIPTAYV